MNPLMIKIGTAAAALVAGGSFAVLSPSSTAVAYSSPGLFLDVSIQSPGTLVAKGAAVSVPVIVTCNTSSNYTYLYVQISEKVGNKLAAGSTDERVACTGGHETLLVTVPASPGVAFAKGSAYATAQISGCGYYDCGSETASATIRIK